MGIYSGRRPCMNEFQVELLDTRLISELQTPERVSSV
jgi:hypothetical protein